MFRPFVTAALLGALSMSSVAFATEAYRPLPPVSGTLHAGRHGMYGDRGFGPVRDRADGPAVYDLRGGGGAGRTASRRDAVRNGRGRGAGGRHRGYGDDRSLTVRYREPPFPLEAGPANYAGQGFVPEGGAPGAGPMAYDQVAQPYGQGGGLGFYTAGGYGAGPRIIAVPDRYNVGYVAGGTARSGCGCGSSGLFGSFGGRAAY